MRHRSWWLSAALIAGPCLVACQQTRTDGEGEAPLSRIPDRYEIIDLGTLEGDALSFPTGVNNNGQVVGMSVSADYSVARGFFWDEEEGLTELWLPEDYVMMWTGNVNDAGVVVGTLFSYTQPPRAFLWEQGELSIIDPPAGGSYTEAYSLNENGDVVGITDFPPAGDMHAFLLSQGEFTDLGALEGGAYSFATDINEAGDIVGYSHNGVTEVGIVWVNGGERMVDLSTVLNVPDFIPYAIAEGSDMAGYSWDLNHAIFVEPGADAVDLGTLAGANGYSEAFDLNTEEQVIGISSTVEGRYHAFIWEDGQMVDLNERIDPDEQVELLQAMSINELGEIGVFGVRGTEQRAFLLRPSEPVTGEQPQ